MANGSESRFYVFLTVASLALAACTGVLLRFGLYLGMPDWAQSYSAVRHAHSHLMYFGWVTLGLMLFIWDRLPFLTSRRLPRGVGWQMGTSALLALLSFPAFWINGYGVTQIGGANLPLGSIAAGMNGLVWFVFVGLYVRATWRLPVRPLPVQMWDWALVLLLVAALGAVGVAAMVAMGNSSIALQQFFLHLFLDLFAVGWLSMALLGVLWVRIDPLGESRGWLPSQSLAIMLSTTFLLGMSPMLVTGSMFWLASTANVGAAALICRHLYMFWQRRGTLPPLVLYGLVLLGIHLLTALVIVAPGVWRWSAGTQLRVWVLHNFLLGWVSSALLGVVVVQFGRLRAWQSRLVDVLWIGGVSIMLIALLGIGLIQFVNVPAIMLLKVAAWASILPAAAALFLAGLLALQWGAGARGQTGAAPLEKTSETMCPESARP